MNAPAPAPPTTPLNELTAREALALLAHRRISAESLVRACLERIALREPVVHAWASLVPKQAIAEARRRDAAPSPGPLNGILIAVKDVFDTADLPTEMGSPIYKGHRPRADAAAVAQLRAAGAVVLGKSVTAEFAGMAPSETANPLDPARTPGGSSSGSAAAVADCMVPIGLGSQTGGSVLRPASYCGVVGYKPTFGRISRAGLKLAAESLDTVGWMARSVDDVALIDAVLAGGNSVPPVPVKRPRIALCRTYLWDEALPETKEAVESAARRLAAAGASVEAFDLPDDFAGLTEARGVINDYERARALIYEWAHHRDLISPELGQCVERGLATPHGRYLEALRFSERSRIRFDELAAGYDAVLAPCVTGEAPDDLGFTGDPRFQSLWTLLHVPALALPTHRGPSGLPVAIQLVAARHADARLLAVASAVWSTFEPEKGA